MFLVLILTAEVRRRRLWTTASSTTLWPRSTPPWPGRTRPGTGRGRGTPTGQTLLTLKHTLIHTRSWTESVISMSIKIAHEQIDHHLQCDPYGQLVGLD